MVRFCYKNLKVQRNSTLSDEVKKIKVRFIFCFTYKNLVKHNNYCKQYYVMGVLNLNAIQLKYNGKMLKFN